MCLSPDAHHTTASKTSPLLLSPNGQWRRRSRHRRGHLHLRCHLQPTALLSGPSLKTTSTLYSTPPPHKPQTAALINTLRHQFAEHIRTTLYNTRTYALNQQAVLHSAHPPVNNFPLPPSPFILHLHPNNGLPYDTPAIPTSTAYPVHSVEPLDFSQFHIGSPLP